MTLLTRPNYMQNSVQVMLSVPGNRFLLVKNGEDGLWEVTYNFWVLNFNKHPALIVREEIRDILAIDDSEYELVPLFSIKSLLDDKSMKVFAVKMTKMFRFTALPRKLFRVLTIDQIINDILLEGLEPGASDKYSANSMTVLRNIGDSDLLWDKRLKNSWEKKSSLQV